MEIFMRDIAFATSQQDLKVEFSKVLHNPPFPSQPPLNFEVDIFKRNPNWRGKCGILALPTEEAGKIFLRTYGSAGIIVNHRRIYFKVSTKEINRARIQMLNSNPWRDPLQLQQEKDRRIQESKPFPLVRYAFGRFLPDGSFSAEIFLPGTASISCQGVDRRQVRFEFRPSQEPIHGDLGGLMAMLNLDNLFDTCVAALYTPSKIEALFESRAEHPPVVFFRTNSPPVPQRLRGLMRDQPMPSGCHSLMLVFNPGSDAEDFVHACRSRLHLDYSLKPRISVRDNLFSPTILQDLDKFLSDLQFELAFEVEKTITRSILSALEVLAMEREIADLQREYGRQASQIFQAFASLIEEGGTSGRKRRRHGKSVGLPEDYQAVLTSLLHQAIQHFVEEQQRPRPVLSLVLVEATAAAAVYLCYHLILTPTRYILEGPLPDQSNSVLRRFGHHESFLRVSFQDENQTKLRRDTEFSIAELLRIRYRPILLQTGCRVAGRPYELLGHSMSGLREHSVWFVSPFVDRNGQLQNAESIRNSLGQPSLLLHQPARLSARWAQAFSATDPSVTLRPDEIDLEFPDKISETGQLMTDGCSPISVDLAGLIWRSMQKGKRRPAKLQDVPSAFQFRLGGAKGVVVQDPSIPGRHLRLRPSQIKFDAPNNLTFDVQSTSLRPKAMFLNRPLIVLMEYCQVDSERIIQLQDDAIHRAQSVRSSFNDASKVLQQHGLGASFHLPSLFRNVSSILRLGMDGIEERDRRWDNELVESALHCAETHILRELKYRAHIEVPGSYTLLGVSDEWGCLREGEIYATVRDPKTGKLSPITGSVAITRSPQIHPGDLQVVEAVIRPELKHLTNVVVFSCEGQRSLASCLGGGDLDGDDFNIILDPKLIPRTVKRPGAYEGLPIKTTAHECGIADVVDFIFDYIESDLVGYIAISHLRFSDLKDPSCDECLQLAKFASHAVDFPKTGTPVNFTSLPRFAKDQPKPDFLAREGNDLQSDRYYTSNKLLGILFRRVPVKKWYPKLWNENYSPSGGTVVETALSSIHLHSLGLPAPNEPSEELLEEMRHLLDAYCDQLFAIAKVHTITKNKDAYVSEAELMSGTIMANWSDHRRRRDAVSAMNLQTSGLVRAVRAEFRPSELAAANEEDYEEEDYEDWTFREVFDEEETLMMSETFKRAWAAWYVAEDALAEYPDAFGPQSFGLIALGRMLEIVKESLSM
ncbi:RdRP-domain-containing protein [Sparassis latifolia]